MADKELVERVRQGVKNWNAWRLATPWVQLDLSEADLSLTDLHLFDLGQANLRGADLSRADLRGADLSRARLVGANLRKANLCGADLSDAHLWEADLSLTNLSEANLSGADLSETSLSEANLSNANLFGTYFGQTTFAKVDLHTTKGLTSLRHHGPSYVELFSIQLPQDGSALHFLRGTGVPDEWIDFWQATMMHPIQYHSCFISYSSKDELLACRLHADLQASGVRCWFAPEDLKIGDRFHSRVNEAIHLQDKLLLLLSESAIQSDWVEIEVRAALEKEQRQHRDVLFPVRLDNSVMETSQAWAAMLRQSRHIGDFTNWTDPQAYQVAFKCLLADLKKTNEQQDQETKQ